MPVPVAAASADGKPNILVVVVDDLGWSDVGFNDPTFSTPNINALAAEGVNLDAFYVSPTCTPTRAQLMTGRYNYKTGMQDSVVHSTEPRGVPLNQQFLSQKLQRAGYATAAVGKWHLGMHQEQYTPLRRGFDRHYGILTGGGGHTAHRSVSQSFTTRQTNVSRTFDGYNIWEDGAVSADNYGTTHSSELYSGKALQYLQELGAQDAPWFVYLAYQAVHDPVETDAAWYTGNSCANISDTGDAAGADIDWDNRPVLCGMAAQIDYGLGQLRAELEAQGAWNSTVVFFLSDNGGVAAHGSSNLPLYGGKGEYWEGGVRVPAFVSGGYVARALARRGKAPYTFTGMVHVTDVHATALSVAGYSSAPQSALDGVDHWRAFVATGAAARDALVINLNSPYFGGSGAVRVGNFKLLRNADPKEAQIYAKVKTLLKKQDAHVTEDALYSLAQQELARLGLDVPTMHLFDISQNPSERVDGNCTVAAACSDLYDDADYASTRAALEAFFANASAAMAPATFKWADDGPLAAPDNFGGAWAPWRDRDGNAFAAYYGLQPASAATSAAAMLTAGSAGAVLAASSVAGAAAPRATAVGVTAAGAAAAASLLALFFYRSGSIARRRRVYRPL
ncbi:Formylglycine-dependent sulfatase [Tribonema minus]|uniref:Formylglycine-dependent sulfatase n=1 Tax=Tribonema minus TaxID=303371 RepID=A0A835ZF60_9STRA|nr:Formylglycine-dependent sulfatase [Tribonema minus]